MVRDHDSFRRVDELDDIRVALETLLDLGDVLPEDAIAGLDTALDAVLFELREAQQRCDAV